MRKISPLLCLCLALAAPATAFADATARVLSVTPGVRYDLNGTYESLAVKMDVPLKATVESDATGKAQLIFPDDSTVSIAPDTRIALAEYVDAEQEENIVLDLVSGTARVITGESNRRNPQAFTVNTPQASIGIRGTLVTIQTSGDVTRVYLSETSGMGVSVRNLNTGQVMELRKPGMIINVGASFMEERKANKEEAASYSAALRGKSRAAIQAATAQAEMQRAAAESITPEGTLPPAGLADPVQVAALATDDRLTQARLVAEATPTVPSVPETPSAPSPASPAVPAVPAVPETPEVPPLPPEPPLPGPDADTYVITDFSQIANAQFKGSGNFDYSFNGNFITSDMGEVGIQVPQQYTSYDANTFTTSGVSFDFPVIKSTDIDRYQVSTFKTSGASMKLNMDGCFTVEYKFDNIKSSASLQGKLTSPTMGTITDFSANIQDSYQKTELKEPMSITR